ncbi:MAG: T9SS type A sorting domain-containing protein [Bacteroidota bacterium]
MPSRPWSRRTARRRLAWLRRSAAAGTLTLAMLHDAPIAEAQAPVAVGPEFQVNTFTTDFQGNASVGMDADGDFVVAWTRFVEEDYDVGVYAQRFAADGSAQGSEFLVNTFTEGDQFGPSMAVDTDGDFVVAWTSRNQDGDGNSIYAQRFASDGSAQGSEFRVNTFTTGNQSAPSVAVDGKGDFVVAWASRDQDGDAYGVYAQRYAADGVPQNEEFQVNTSTAGDQFGPSVAADTNGDFVVAWQSSGQDGDEFGIFAQRYAADGTPQGNEFQVNTFTTGDQFGTSVAIDGDGDFVIVWQSQDQDGDNDGVYARRYAADGSARDPEFCVNTFTTGRQDLVAVAMDTEGNFVATWTSRDQGGDVDDIFAQSYTANGLVQGKEFRVNTFTTNRQRNSSVAVDEDGNFVVVWQSFGQDGDTDGIFAQRFEAFPLANEDDAPLPTTPALDAVFPNPARDAATLRYALPTAATVRLNVTDLLGRAVLSRTEGVRPAGQHEAQIALDGLPSGVYVVRLDADGANATQRVTLIR